ncbi:formyltetrahydrofolate deformylase [Candidatus Margulisiibacteriota bacterium]
MPNTAILLVNCKDKKGLVAGITGFIYENKGNIINLDQYTNCVEEKFFMRVEWEMKGFSLSKDKLRKTLPELAKKLGIDFQLHFSDEKLNVAIMVSKYDHCLFDLLLRKRSGELNINIPVIISNHSELKDVAKMFDIEFVNLPIKGNKIAQEKQALKVLGDNNIDFIVLARYMQILSGSFIKEYKDKIINVHHSFLPAFSGAKPYHQAFKKGVKVIGATSHFVTAELDAGPIIEQETIKITHKDSVDDLIMKGRDLERKVLAQAVQLFSQHRLFIDKQRTIIL